MSSLQWSEMITAYCQYIIMLFIV